MRSFWRRRCGSMRRRTTGSSCRASAWASRSSSAIAEAGSSAWRGSRCSVSTGRARARRASRRRPRRTDATSEVSTPADARLTDVYWQRPENTGRATFDADAPFGLPFRPSPFRARVEMTLAGTRIVRELPVQYRYEGPGLVGEKRMELNVVPAFAVSVSPQIVVVPRKPGASAAGAVGRPRAARDRHQRLERTGVRHGAAQDSGGMAGVAADRGDDASRARTSRRRRASRSRRRRRRRRASRRFPPKSSRTLALRPATFGVGYQVIEYPHIQRRHKIVPAVARFKVIDVAIPAGADGRLHHGRRRPGAGGAAAARRARHAHRQRRDGMGRSLQVQRHRHRRARVRATRGSPREQSSAAEVRRGRRDRHRSIQPDGVQSGAVRALSGRGPAPSASPTRTRRSRSSRPAIRCSTFPTS